MSVSEESRVDGWTVREAAQRLLCSEATVRRRLLSGILISAEGPGPLRVTHESVAIAQASMLRSMGLPVESAQDPNASGAAAEERGDWASPSADELQTEVQRLKGALADLTAAHASLLDTFRRLSEGALPNN